MGKRTGERVRCRVGVNTGKCIGGIIGTEMQRYHLFGELMDSLDALESTAPEGRVHVSGSCKVQAEIELSESDEIVDLDSCQAVDHVTEISFCVRNDPQLLTSKGEIVDFSKVGGAPTYLLADIDGGVVGTKPQVGVRFLPAIS